MAFLSLFELIDIFIMTLFLSLIFSQWFEGSFLEKIYKAAFVSAPAVLLHELGHKTVALILGVSNPTFYSACSASSFFGSGVGEIFSWTCILMIVSVFLGLIGFGFIFFVPAFVSFSSDAGPLVLLLIAFAGPLVNLVLFFLLRINSDEIWKKAAKLNLLLFIFNILPIPGFDGWHILYNILQIFA
jgi:Zn-dependent protease